MPANKWVESFWAGQLTDGWLHFGAHPGERDGQPGWDFCVWAPHAARVSVVGDFNGWNADSNPLAMEDGIWTGFIAGLDQFDVYKYAITGSDGKKHLKADPYAFHAETRPGTGSKLYAGQGFEWSDGEFIKNREHLRLYNGPLNIYEAHIGSWRRRPRGETYDYRTFGYEVAEYLKEMGYNAIELMPVMEYPLDDSWGYQCTGYFAPTSRYGTPDDLKWMINHLHENGILVILDWVPSHFCKDEFGLIDFDGGATYEYADPRKKEHYSWGTRVFDFAKNEVISFLCSSARYWLEEFHADGLRVDAVASMLYLDYDRKAGEWTPNVYGGHENLEAIEFLKTLNRMAFSINPHVIMAAEESTAWPMVTKPTDMGGLGFNFKWNMGWMNNMCHYLKLDPFFRKDNHNDITFSLMYAFSENFILPISHDEVVHMKGSLVNKMPGDYPMQLQSMRGFYTYMLTHPGKKLMFMGAELGQWHEWNSNEQLDWYLLDNEINRQTAEYFKSANYFYLEHPALWEIDYDWTGFEWLVTDDTRNNMVVFIRRDKAGQELLVAVNFSPNTYDRYRVGVPARARYVPVFNSDEVRYGGGGYGDTEPVQVEWIDSHGRETSVSIKVPPFGAVILEGEGEAPPKPKKTTAKAKPEASVADGVEKQKPAIKKVSRKSGSMESPEAVALEAAAEDKAPRVRKTAVKAQAAKSKETKPKEAKSKEPKPKESKAGDLRPKAAKAKHKTGA